MKGFIQNQTGSDWEIPNVDELRVGGDLAVFYRKRGGDSEVVAAVRISDGVAVSIGEEPLK